MNNRKRRPARNQLLFSMVTPIILAMFIVISNTPGKDKTKDFSSVKELITHIKENRADGHLEQFTFVQETVRFDENGSAQDTTTWYEAIRYPKDFRIDFGNSDNGNANINRNDSIYVYRGHKLVHSGPEVQEFLILEGGLFYYSVEETLERLQGLGIDPSLFSKSEYKGKPVYILGAGPNDPSKPQIWVDAQELYVVRRFSQGKHGELYEVKYDDFKNIGGNWLETWIEFHVDGKLIQTERYNNIDVDPNLDDAVFDPTAFGSYYWFKS
ncbi:MAG: hypothetical protein R2819_12590 [Allomuricauda sp.]